MLVYHGCGKAGCVDLYFVELVISSSVSLLDLSLFVQYNPANQKFWFYPNFSMTKNFRFYASFYFYDNSSLVVVGGV